MSVRLLYLIFVRLGTWLVLLGGVTQITRTLQAIGRDRTRVLNYLPL